MQQVHVLPSNKTGVPTDSVSQLFAGPTQLFYIDCIFYMGLETFTPRNPWSPTQGFSLFRSSWQNRYNETAVKHIWKTWSFQSLHSTCFDSISNSEVSDVGSSSTGFLLLFSVLKRVQMVQCQLSLLTKTWSDFVKSAEILLLCPKCIILWPKSNASWFLMPSCWINE